MQVTIKSDTYVISMSGGGRGLNFFFGDSIRAKINKS